MPKAAVGGLLLRLLLLPKTCEEESFIRGDPALEKDMPGEALNVEKLEMTLREEAADIGGEGGAWTDAAVG